MSFFKSLNLLFICLLFASQVNATGPNGYTSPCKESRYKLSEDTTLCSRNREDYQKVDRLVILTKRLYNDYIDSSLTVPPNLVIIILTNEEINNESLFPEVKTRKAVGRYMAARNVIYITKEALLPNSTTLAHEIIHAFNTNSEIGNKKDEELAYKFEAHFQTYYQF